MVTLYVFVIRPWMVRAKPSGLEGGHSTSLLSTHPASAADWITKMLCHVLSCGYACKKDPWISAGRVRYVPH